MQAQVTSPLGRRTNVRSGWALNSLRASLRLAGRVLPGPTAQVAASFFLRPHRRQSSPTERSVLARAQRFRFEVHGLGELPAWSWGDGPAVLLVHGWGGSAAQMTPFVQPLLARGFSVLAFDAPAHGSAGGRRSSLLEYARAIRTLIHRVGDVRGVVAHSGGAAAARYAIATGARVQRAVFVGASAQWEPYLSSFGELLGLSDEVLGRMRANIERKMGVSMDELRADLVVDGQLERLLVVHDREDREVPSRHAEQVAHGWPQAELLLTQGLGHRRILADPTVHARVVDLMAGEVCGQVEERPVLEGSLAAGA